jgi:cytoskeletal protein CcmA (bactofilin family)
MALDWKKESPEPDEWAGFLEAGIELDGSLACQGTFRVNCSVKGRLSSKQRLLLGAQAEVEGELEAQIVVVEGNFAGTIHAYERVEIKQSASVDGEITSPCFLIEPGATFRGKCHVIRRDERLETVLVRPADSLQK